MKPESTKKPESISWALLPHLSQCLLKCVHRPDINRQGGGDEKIYGDGLGLGCSRVLKVQKHSVKQQAGVPQEADTTVIRLPATLLASQQAGR